MRRLNALFAREFEEPETYNARPPGDAYLRELLSRPHFIALCAFQGAEILGGLVAYVLQKFEQERSEIYIYDLAVARAYRRQGIATALIEKLRALAPGFGTSVIFVQADTTSEDVPAQKLYASLGTKESVYHYDISV